MNDIASLRQGALAPGHTKDVADALMAQSKRDEARELYTQALAKLDVAAPQRRLLETKLMDAGGTVADPAAEKN